MKGVVSFNKIKKEFLKKPKVREAYKKEHARAMVALQIIELREKKHLSQKELARRLHTTQQTISKLEQLDNNTTIGTMEKVAKHYNKDLIIKFEEPHNSWHRRIHASKRK